MSGRGTYGKRGGDGFTASTAVGLGLVIVGALLAPVVAVVGGTLLATAFGGRGEKR